MQAVFQRSHFLQVTKHGAFLAALQEVEKCKPFFNVFILSDLQNVVHFLRPYMGLENATSFHNGSESREMLPLR